MADQSLDEIWRLSQAHPEYEVSNRGRVRRITDVTYTMPNGGIATRLIAGKILTNSRLPAWRVHDLPYVRVGLLDRSTNTTKGVMVHKLVADAFVPNPDNKPCVNHINSDASDPRAVNLEWCTHKENTMHSYLAGRLKVPHPGHGVDNPHAKLTDDDVRKIREMSATGLSNAKVAKVFGIDRSKISRIKNGRAWKHVI